MEKILKINVGSLIALLLMLVFAPCMVNARESISVNTIEDYVFNERAMIAEMQTDGNLEWSIDANGHLLIEGNGNYENVMWSDYSKQIISATINVSEITTMEEMFYNCKMLEVLDLSNCDMSDIEWWGNINLSDCGALKMLRTPLKMSSECEIELPTPEKGYAWFVYEDNEYVATVKLVTPEMTGQEIHLMKIEDTFENSDQIVHCGVDGELFWAIDTNNHLCIKGKGDYEDAAWLEYSDEIVSVTLDVSEITDATGMFAHCSSVTSVDMRKLDAGKIESMHWMFQDCANLTTLVYDKLNTNRVTDMGHMFAGCTSLSDIDMTGINTEQVLDMSEMFMDCKSLSNVKISTFDKANVTDMSYMFCGCESLQSLNLVSFNTTNVTDMSYMFCGCESLKTLNLNSFNTQNVVNMENMFTGCISLNSLNINSFDTANVKDMSSMFRMCKSLKNLDLSHFNTGQTEDMGWMFYGCDNLESLNVHGFDTSKVKEMVGMFEWCSKLTSLDLSDFNTQCVTTMYSMFYQCNALSSLDISSFDTSQVTTMYGMFLGCSSLKYLDLKHFNTSQVTDMSSMFEACESIERLNISKFDTTKVTDMNWMFGSCTALTSLDLSNISISQGTKVDCMLYHCTNLQKIITASIMDDEIEIDLPRREKKNDVWYIYTNGVQGAKITDVTSAYAGKELRRIEVTTNTPSDTEGKKIGTVMTSKNVSYKVTNNKKGKCTVAYVKNKKKNATSVTIPATVKISGVTYKVTEIAKNAFKNNKKLKKVKIGKNVKTINDKAFYKCTALTAVTMPSTVTKIGTSAFEGCTKLKTVTIGKNVKTIGDKAFYKCTALTKITIPSKVNKIGKSAFANCKKLKTITIKTTKLTKKNVGSKAFKSIYSKATIKVPKSKLKTYKTLLKSKGVGSKVKIKK